jgi:uncharacterized protein (DUF58 family)
MSTPGVLRRLRGFARRERSAGVAGGSDPATRPRATSAEASLAQGQRLAAALPPLLVAAERVAQTVSQGVHGRRRVGQGEAFWQFRVYQPGDAPQRIDWKQSAKSDQVYVRQSEWEAAQSVWLWRDASASMAYRSRRGLPPKLERAELLLLAVAALLARGGEHFAFLDAGEPPATGRPALLRLTAWLERRAHADASWPKRPAGLPRFARVVVFGDFLAPLEELQAGVARLTSAGVQGHLVQVLDPAEETLPFAGRVLFEGPEGEGSLLVGRTEALRDDYRAALCAHRAGLQAIARSFGWSLLVHHTDQPPAPALLSLYTALAGAGGG